MGGEPDFLGPALPDDVAHAIALGERGQAVRVAAAALGCWPRGPALAWARTPLPQSGRELTAAQCLVLSLLTAGDLDPISKQPFGEELLQPCTGPLAADAAASGSQPGPGPASLRPLPSGWQQKNGRGKSGRQQQVVPGAGNGGNTLANYSGFLRGLAKLSAAAAEFRPPRAGSSQPGSQDSAEALRQQQQPQQGEEQGEQEEEQQQEEQAARLQQDEEQQQQQQQQHTSLPASPQAAHQPAGEALPSPTEQQWEEFRQKRRKGIGKGPPPGGAAAATAAAAAAAAAAAGDAHAPATSSYFAQPAGAAAIAGTRKTAAAPQASDLLARLRTALQAKEPTIDELLR